MNLEQLKAEAREKYVQHSPEIGDYMDSFGARELDHLIEHTHTQTIQSVRERVEKLKKEDDECIKGQVHRAYNQALTDLLKDLKAPVEGEGV